MGGISILDEDAMRLAESQIPLLATKAGRAAYARAISNPANTLVMKSADGQLVLRKAGGGVVVLKELPAGTPARLGTVLRRPWPTTTHD